MSIIASIGEQYSLNTVCIRICFASPVDRTIGGAILNFHWFSLQVIISSLIRKSEGLFGVWWSRKAPYVDCQGLTPFMCIHRNSFDGSISNRSQKEISLTNSFLNFQFATIHDQSMIRRKEECLQTRLGIVDFRFNQKHLLHPPRFLRVNERFRVHRNCAMDRADCTPTYNLPTGSYRDS